MADWYVSSVAWAAIAQFAATTPYTVGQIVRPLTAPAFTAQYTFRCTVAGTSGAEPSWPAANNGTITTGGVTFTNVSGQSAYGWSAAAGNLASLTQAGNNRTGVGDRCFLSSDHSESNSTNTTWLLGGGTQAFGLVQIISVNRAGSVPPVAADITNGASIATSSGNAIFDAYCNLFWQGVTLSANGDLRLNGTPNKQQYCKNCALVISGATASSRIGPLGGSIKLILDNTTAQFGNVGQTFGPISNASLELLWINTASPIQGATIPTSLFSTMTFAGLASVTCRGVDFNTIVGTLCTGSTSSGGGALKGLFDSCRVASGVTRLAAPLAASTAADEVELVNCWDGANVINERHTYAGDLVTDRVTYLNSGAQDDIGSYSLKLVSATRSDFAAYLCDAFAFDIENIITGVSKTAVVEIISSSILNNNDIRLQLEYMGTSGNPVASFIDSLASVLTAASALPGSSNTWNSPPSTPQRQLLQVAFTPQRAGRVRGLVRLGKPSTTVWVNPQIAIV